MMLSETKKGLAEDVTIEVTEIDTTSITDESQSSNAATLYGPRDGDSNASESEKTFERDLNEKSES